MDIIGALSKSQSDKTIFLCDYSNTDFEKNAITNFLSVVNYNKAVYSENVQVLAIESSDEMVEDITLVGLVYKNGNNHIFVTLNGYNDLPVYLEEIIEVITE